MRAMFGMGGSEILVILIVALLFLGPDKLPEAAKQISKGIRDIKKQSRALQQTIEDDEHIGGAIRDLRSALRGEEAPIKPKPIKPKEIEATAPEIAATTAAIAAVATGDAAPDAAGAHDAHHHDPHHDVHGVHEHHMDAHVPPLAGEGTSAGDVVVVPPLSAIAHDDAHVAVAAFAQPAAAEPPAHATVDHVTAQSSSDAAASHAHEPAPAAPAVTLPPMAGEPDPEAPVASPDEASELAGLVKPAPNTIARGAAGASSDETPERKHG